MKEMSRIISSFENRTFPLPYGIIWLLSIILLRNFLEAFSSETYLYRFSWFFVHYPLFYIALFIYLALLIYLLSRERIESIFRVMLAFFPVILLPPIIDIIATGIGGSKMRYLSSDLSQNFFTFFGSPFNSRTGITMGIKIEILIILIAIFCYLLAKRKNILTPIIGTVASYILIFFFVSTPVFKNEFTRLLQRYRLVSDMAYLSFELYYIILIIIGGALLLLAYDSKLLRVILFELRLPRLLHFLLMFFGGLWLGLKGRLTLFKSLNTFDFIFICVAIAFLWLFAVLTNDIFDTAGDKLSERQKPLTKYNVNKGIIKAITAITLITGLGITALVDYKYFALGCVFTALYWIYSAPPFRLKRIPIVATFIIAFASLTLTLMGTILAGNRLSEHSLKASALILVCFTLAFNVKDLKDIEADKFEKVYTIPVLLGKKYGKLVVGALSFLAFLLVPIILGSSNPLFFLISLLAGLITIFISTRKTVHEWAFFLLYYSYLFCIFILLPYGKEALLQVR